MNNAKSRQHTYDVRAFDRNDVYVCHRRDIVGRAEVDAYKRAMRLHHPGRIAYFRVWNVTLGIRVGFQHEKRGE